MLRNIKVIKLKCIYLTNDDVCVASPIRIFKETDEYKPEPVTLQKYCKHESDMRCCPRLETYQNHLKSINK